jgi:hypothetical protein
VSSLYDAISEVTDDQIVIFETIVAWIAGSVEMSTRSNAALLIAAFFVLNCEVFDEVP